MIAAFGDTPVIVLGRRSDVLAWNRTGHALFAGHLDPDSPEQPARRPNTARLVFLDPHTRDLYENWPRKARDAVGKLRLAVGEHPDDPEPAELIGQLTPDRCRLAHAGHRRHRLRFPPAVGTVLPSPVRHAEACPRAPTCFHNGLRLIAAQQDVKVPGSRPRTRSAPTPTPPGGTST
ncbi:hypothetical protein AB0K24_07150 [Streptomyces mirabilis]|uniref:MmyB family transcriptional regulator n=1 Tax=Streptomyces mirabilis TaxID=68239 RepID=UPI00343ED9BA